jgi:uncharacterized protein (DUF885 family)
MVRRLTTTFFCACLSTLVSACNRGAKPASKPHPEADARVRALADAYLQGYVERYPDAKTLYGVPGAHHDQLPDNSFEALKAWHAKEDAWLADAKQIDPAAIAAAPLRATYAITRGPRRLDRGTGVPVRAVDGQPVRQRVAGQLRSKRSTTCSRTLQSRKTTWCRRSIAT